MWLSNHSQQLGPVQGTALLCAWHVVKSHRKGGILCPLCMSAMVPSGQAPEHQAFPAPGVRLLRTEGLDDFQACQDPALAWGPVPSWCNSVQSQGATLLSSCTAAPSSPTGGVHDSSGCLAPLQLLQALFSQIHSLDLHFPPPLPPTLGYVLNTWNNPAQAQGQLLTPEQVLLSIDLSVLWPFGSFSVKICPPPSRRSGLRVGGNGTAGLTASCVCCPQGCSPEDFSSPHIWSGNAKRSLGLSCLHS